MSEPGRPGASNPGGEDDRPQGPNLKLIYALIALAMLAAIGIAAWIVLPFYTRR